VNARSGPLPHRSVSVDWRAPLSPEKSQAFQHSLRCLETAYAMFSVNLDEAIGLRRYGHLQKSCQVLSLSSTLCERFTLPLTELLRAMLAHSKHFGTVPNLAPLDAENFLISRSQRAALFNTLFSKVLLTRKMQFLHKLSTLVELIEDLRSQFRSSTENLAEGVSTDPDQDWEALDSAHFDLNTALRESVVIFKCFLHALPAGQLHEFQDPLFRQLSSSLRVVPRLRHLAHRRLTLIKGQ
jgi:hypothetical protein